MSTEIASAYVSLVPSFRGGSRALSSALAGPIGKAGPAAGRSLGRSILSGVTKAAAVGGGLAAALGVANLGKAAVSAASGLQNTTATLTGLLGSAEAARDTMARLRDVARNSPISYQSYLQAAESLAYMGYQGEEAAGILQNVGAAVTAAGGDDQAIGRATDAMLQMVNSGKVYAAQLNQISATGIPIFSALADHFNTNIANVREMVTAGEVGISDVMEAIKNASGDTFQSMIAASDGASKTLSNQWRIAKDAIVTALADQLLPVIEALTPAAQRFAQAAPAAIERAAAGVSSLVSGIRGIPKTAWFGSLASIGGSVLEDAQELVQGVRRELNQLPRTNWFSGLRNDTLERFSSIWASLQRTFAGVLPSLREIAAAVGSLVSSLARASAAIGVSAWSVFLAVADSLAALLEAVLVPALSAVASGLSRVAVFMRDNEGVTRAVVAAYTAWKVGALVASLVSLASALVASTVATVRDTAATVANSVAKVKNKAETLFLVGLYARDAAAKAASTAATVAGTVATKAMTVAQRALNLVLRANPIGIVITVLTALAAAIVTAWKRSETFRNIVTAVWAAIQKAAKFAWDSIIKPVLDGFGGALSWLWDRAVVAKDKIVGAWRGIRNYLGSAWAWIRDNAINPLRDGFQSAWDKAVAVKDGIVDAWKTVAGAIGGAFENVVDGIKRALDKVFGFIDKWLIRPINAVLDVFNVKNIPPLSGSGGKTGRSLPKFHTGGHVPGRSEYPALLLGGESVLNREATDLLGKDTIDDLNNGTYKHRRGDNDPRAMGGWGDIAGAVWRGLKAIDPRYDAAEKILKKGAEASIKAIVDPGLAKIREHASGTRVATGPAIGTAEIIRDKVMEWAKSTDKEAGAQLGEGNLVGGTPSFTGKFAFPLPRGSYRVGGGIGSYPGHTGRDFPAPVGTPVFSPMDGRVSYTRMAGSFGLHANVYAGALRFIAAHLSSFVGGNRMVKAGELIGRVGSTGNSTGPHLHAEFRRNGVVVNPDQYIGMDTGIGVLKPGHNLVYNGTGADEPIVDPRKFGGGDRSLVVNTYGTPRQLVSDVVFAIDAQDRSRRKVMA